MRAPVLSFLLLVSAASVSAGCLAPYWEQKSLSTRSTDHVTAADFDGDGRPDLAGLAPTAVFVAKNDGTGRFSPFADVYTGTPTGQLLSGDFNNDAKTDLLFAADGVIVVLRGNGDGTFAPPIESAIDIRPAAIAAARFDVNATLDLAAVDSTAAKLVLYRNDGTGKFTASASYPVADYAISIAAADFDSDGRQDVVVGYGIVASFDAFYGHGDGTADPRVSINSGFFVSVIVAGDVDGDGLPDLVGWNRNGFAGVIRNLGRRSFGDPLTYRFTGDTGPTGSIAIADLTLDGKMDVIASTRCGVRTGTGAGNGALGLQLGYEDRLCNATWPVVTDLATGDFDGDGRIDAVTTFPSDAAHARFMLYRNRCSESSFSAAADSQIITRGQPLSITATIDPPVPQIFAFTIRPTGKIVLRDGQSVVATQAAASINKFSLPDLTLGDHTFVVEYEGDQQYGGRTSTAVVVHVTTATTTTQLSVDPPFGIFGLNPHLTARVTSSTGDAPTGVVRFVIDGRATDDAVNAPVAAIDVAAGVGAHTYTANFAGDATHPPSSATITYVVEKQTPSIQVVSPFAVAGASNTVRIVLNRQFGWEYPTGTVSLLGAGDQVVTATVGPEGQAYGVALPALPAGRGALRVRYSGDAKFAAAETVVPYVVFPVSPIAVEARGSADGVFIAWNTKGSGNLSRAKAGTTAWELPPRCCGNSSFFDDVPAEVPYLYRTETDDKAMSSVDVGMRFSFTNDPLLPEAVVTPHLVDEIIRATNILRTAANLPPAQIPAQKPKAPAPRGRVIGIGSGVSASTVSLLRNAINEAREKLGAYRFDFVAALSEGGAVNATQLQELREAVR